MVDIFVGMNLIGCRKQTDSSSLKCVDLRIHTHGQYLKLLFIDIWNGCSADTQNPGI